MKNLFLPVKCLAVLLVVVTISGRTALAQRPIVTQSVDEPGRNTFVLAVQSFSPNPNYASFTVPAGKRYVVDHYTAQCSVAPSNPLTEILINVVSDGVAFIATVAPHFTNTTIGGAPTNWYSGTGTGPLYADAGTTIAMVTSTSSNAAAAEPNYCNFYVSGHVINNP